MNTQLYLTAGNLTHIVNNLTFYKAEAIAENAPNEIAIYDDGENEFVLNNATGLDYTRWSLFSDAEDATTHNFFARDLDHARRITQTILDHYQSKDDYRLTDEEGEVFEL